MRFRQTIIALCAALAAVAVTNVRAEVSEITIAQQYGVSFLPLMEMEKLGLDGTNVYRRDDPIWEEFLTPWDYG